MRARAQVASLVLAASTLVGIAVHEGYRGDAYVPVKGDVPTIGFGSTDGVRMGDRTTPERSLVRLLDEIEGVYAAGVRRCVTVPLYQHEYEAYVSLAYNIGVNAFCRSTLVKLLNQERYVEACEQIKRWNRAGGKVLRGLTIRREAEYKQCMELA